MSENTTEYSNKHHHHRHHHDCGCPQNPVQEDAMLDVKGLKYLLGKLCDKILIAVGVIKVHDKTPLHLWREYLEHGIVINGKIDEVTLEQDGYLTKEDYKSLLEALEDIMKLWAEINDKINPAIKDLQDIVNTQGGQINTINSEIAEINEAIKTINETLTTLQTTVDEQGTKIEEIAASLASLTTRVGNIESRLNSLSDTVTSLLEALTSLQNSALSEVTASGTAPLTLSATRSGTTVNITGSVTAATASSAGVMSAEDKAKLDSLDTGNLVQSASASGTAPLTLSASVADGSLAISGSISAASQSAAGTMSAEDKTRLDNLYTAYQNGELGGISEEQAKELAELWEKYQNGTLEGGTLTNLTIEGSDVNIDATLKVAVGTVSGAGNVVRLSGTPTDGHELHVMLQAVADNTTVRTSTTYTATDGQATTTFTLSNGDWIEYNFIYVGGKYYVRAAASNQ